MHELVEHDGGEIRGHHVAAFGRQHRLYEQESREADRPRPGRPPQERREQEDHDGHEEEARALHLEREHPAGHDRHLRAEKEEPVVAEEVGAEPEQRDHGRRFGQHRLAREVRPARVAEDVDVQQGLQDVAERPVDEQQIAPREASGCCEVRRAELLALVEGVHVAGAPGRTATKRKSRTGVTTSTRMRRSIVLAATDLRIARRLSRAGRS